jgi:hypothetical protein
MAKDYNILRIKRVLDGLKPGNGVRTVETPFVLRAVLEIVIKQEREIQKLKEKLKIGQ